MRPWKLLLAISVTAVALPVLLARMPVLLASAEEKASASRPSTPPSAMPVPVTAVTKETLPVYLEYPARTEAIRNVTLQAKVSGYLLEQIVADGIDVAAGDPLYRIDARDYAASLDQAKAQVIKAVASLDYLRSSRERGTELAKSGYIAKDNYDQRTSAVRQAEADLAIGQAAVRAAEINLQYTELRAPFAGRLGRNQASVGTLVSPSGTVLNTLVQLDPIYVTFNLSETDLTMVQKALAAAPIETDVIIPGGQRDEYKGRVTFLDNTVDRTTGTVAARATITNGNSLLLPGQYVRVRLHIGKQPDALLVPQVAVSSSQLGKFVYIVGEGSKVEQRIVKLGQTYHDNVVILSGLLEGDQVISGNLQKIGPGLPVQPITRSAEALAR
jgi:multidrug efflux system membrane fusion protein